MPDILTTQQLDQARHSPPTARCNWGCLLTLAFLAVFDGLVILAMVALS